MCQAYSVSASAVVREKGVTWFSKRSTTHQLNVPTNYASSLAIDSMMYLTDWQSPRLEVHLDHSTIGAGTCARRED